MKTYLATALLSASLALPALADQHGPEISMLLAGNKEDNGFMEAGYNGLLQIEQEFGAKIAFIDQIKPEKDLLAGALRELAAAGPDMVIAHGGQNNEAAQIVAGEFPEVKFVVVQGGVTGPNLSSYEVLQEESAWLAGAAAGLLTKSGVVGHISGIRVTPGLKGRGGFYNGLMHTRPDAQFVTTFAGDQDDNDLSNRVTKAEMEQGADIIFTMLNAGRTGSIEAMRGTGTRQIGNVIDWTQVESEVFVASAIANVSIPSVEAVRDLVEGDWQPGVVRQIGLENPEAAALVLSPDVSDEVRQQIDGLRQQIIDKTIEVSTEYDGPELEM
ncbi:BMP family protein [Paracoccus marinaquae]|uniref:BMP family protein n=1 Tax=Paracoccus marinaquae TaxID=2841926 RepID=A0ABS6AIJ7_9RHOB|nr:BMP family protein [Paracoccus marinaquae]MBU3029485.1 BMP family protein [Paracoccus marinaquae]